MRVETLPFREYGGGNSELHVFRPEGNEKPYSAVFFHGFGRDWEFYDAVGEEFASRGVTMYMPDMCGHGTSRDKFDLGTMTEHALALGHEIRRREGGLVAAVGHSMGANKILEIQAYDTGGVYGAHIAVATPQSLAAYTDRYPGWPFLKIPGLKAVMKSPQVQQFISDRIDKRIGMADDRIKFGRLYIDDPADFVAQIEGSTNLIAGYNNGFRTYAPTMIIFDENDPHNDFKDSVYIFGAMMRSVDPQGTLILREVSGLDVGLSSEVVKKLADTSVPFMDYHLAA
jgi:pimeloyl-ACP methyl ester carboxylesterase